MNHLLSRRRPDALAAAAAITNNDDYQIIGKHRHPKGQLHSDDSYFSNLINSSNQQQQEAPTEQQDVDKEESSNDIIETGNKKYATPTSSSHDEDQIPNQLTDRLTYLEEPKIEQQLLSNKIRDTVQAGPNSNESEKLHRQNLLTTEQQHAIGSNPTGDLNHSNLYYGLSSILFLIAGLIVYILFRKGRRRRRTPAGKKRDAFGNEADRSHHSLNLNSIWPFKLVSSNPSIKRLSRKHSDELIDSSAAKQQHSEPGNQFGCVVGETIQLVERKSNVVTMPAQDQAEVIQIDNIEATFDEGPAAKRLNNTLVTIKKKLVKNSFVIAASKTTKPKVRLITAKVRKFIDDEAEEIRLKKLKSIDANQSHRWHYYNVLSFLLNSMKSEPVKERETDLCQRGRQQPGASENVIVVTEIDGNNNVDSELKDEPQSNEQSLELKVEVHTDRDWVSREPSLALAGSAQCPEKLAQSPAAAVATAHSSYSNYSLYSTSPMELHQQASVTQPPQVAQQTALQLATCVCGNHQNLQMADHVNCRSKSQGHSPCDTQKLAAGGLDRAPACRPCCSASPSAMPATRRDQQTTTYPSSAYCNLTKQSQLANNFNHHLKRQYENYYDDENQDAYQRLTASIGLELGLNFHDQHHHHHLHHPATFDCGQQRPNCAHHHHHPRTNGNINDFLDYTRYASAYNQTVPTEITCMQQQASDILPPMGAYNSSPCKCCPRPNFNDFMAPDPYLLTTKSTYKTDAAGSAGELLLSSANTSLNGSDNCFNHLQSSKPTCSYNTPCSCQANNPAVLPLKAHPPMSILIQQPSTSTPPPPVLPITTADETSSCLPIACESENYNSDLSGGTSSGAEANGSAETSPNNMNAIQSSPNVILASDQTNRPKWKHRRRFSSNNKQHSANVDVFGCNSQLLNQQAHYPNRYSPRRMSIAGDQVAATMNNQQQQSSIVDNQNQFLHRASIASEGCWTSPYHHQGSGMNAHPHPQQQYFGGRPSDGSLYEPPRLLLHCQQRQHHDQLMNCRGEKWSNYSSSGGSSSGIGFSGSTCTTNTPTTNNFPFASFVNPVAGDYLIDNFNIQTNIGQYSNNILNMQQQHQHQQQQQQQMQQQQLQQQPQAPQQFRRSSHYYTLNSNHAGNHSFNNHQQFSHRMMHLQAPFSAHQQLDVGLNPSRKYSLPVQLESQAAERLASLSNRKGRLLFEKNDSQQLENSNQSSQLDDLTQGQNRPQDSGDFSGNDNLNKASTTRQERIGSFNRSMINNESRRSSQTITRQSSFWLEDSSFDSMLSQLTTSGVCLNDNEGSQIDVASQLCDDQLMRQEPPAASNSRANSQRPSISSLILSADSIESVKQRPPNNSENMPTRRLSADKKDEPSNSSAKQGGDSNSSAISKPKKIVQRKTLSHMKRRFSSSTSSSSTSTASTSTPSPDFGGASVRILAQTSSFKSSSISKRGASHSKRNPRLNQIATSSDGHSKRTSYQQSSHPPYLRHKDESDDDNEDANNARDESTTRANTTLSMTESSFEQQSTDQNDEPESKPKRINEGSEQSSTSLERQCRELWKLRATLHEDCVNGDNWNNYHQRLNRRYDSGYRSIEHQLSSSLEGNLAAAAAAVASANLQQQTNQAQDPSLPRPQSGCSTATEIDKNKIITQELITPCVDIKKSISNNLTEYNSLDSPPFNELDGKLAELDLDDVALECLLSEPQDRECQSRSSRSSNEEDKTKVKHETTGIDKN